MPTWPGGRTILISGAIMSKTGLFEAAALRQAFADAEGNRTVAAKLLDMSKDTLRYRLEKFQIG